MPMKLGPSCQHNIRSRLAMLFCGKKKRFHISGYACQRRNLELGRIYNFFILNGYHYVPESDKADIVILGTCAFISEVRLLSNKLISSTRISAKAKLVIYGCLPAIAPTDLDQWDFDLAITPTNLSDFNKMVETKVGIAEVENFFIPDTGHIGYYIPPESFVKYDNRPITCPGAFPTPFLQISSGCDQNCSYCSERLAFGHHKSIAVARLVESFKALSDQGFEEIVIIGDDIGGYGKDIGTSLPRLLEAFYRVNQQMKIQLKDLNPIWLLRHRSDFLGILEKMRFTHILIPVQSGSRSVLRRMDRDIDVETLIETINQMKLKQQTLNLKYHIIVGFPGETDHDFDQTLDFMSKAMPSNISIYECQLPQNVLAYTFEGKITESQRVKRCERLVEFTKEKGLGFFWARAESVAYNKL